MINDRNEFIIRSIYSGRNNISYSRFLIILYGRGLVYLAFFPLSNLIGCMTGNRLPVF